VLLAGLPASPAERPEVVSRQFAGSVEALIPRDRDINGARIPSGAVVNTTPAIYEALIEANVPAAAARRVAEAREADMTTHLATKQDLLQLEQQIDTRFAVVDARFVHGSRRSVRGGEEAIRRQDRRPEKRLDARIGAVAQSFGLKLKTLESPLVVKLGGRMTIHMGVMGTAIALLR
jgi:hypothetical protein